MSELVGYKRNIDVINQLLDEEHMLREFSPILFLSDGDGWPVIAARVPDGCVSVGDKLREVLSLETEDVMFAGGWNGGTRLVRSAVGVGLLSLRWRFCAGIGLFLRVEAPESELLNALHEDMIKGSFLVSPALLRAAKEPEYVPHERVRRTAGAVMQAAARLHLLAEGMPKPDVFRRVPVDAVTDWIYRVAVAVGCVVNPFTVQRRTYWGQMLDLPPAVSCRWYAEPLWEAFLVTCLLQARQYAPTRSLSCTLSIGDEREHCPADVELRFEVLVPNTHTPVPKMLRRRHTHAPEELPLPPENPMHLPEGVAAGLNQLRLAADTYGAVFRWSVGEPTPSDAEDAVVFPVRAHMVYLSNPHRELEGDIKAPSGIIYDI